MNFQWITQFGCCLRMMNAYICRRKVSTMAEELHRRTHTHIHTHPIPHAPSVDVPSAFHTENFNHFSNYWYEFKCGWNRNFPKSEGRLIENHHTMAYSLCFALWLTNFQSNWACCSHCLWWLEFETLERKLKVPMTWRHHGLLCVCVSSIRLRNHLRWLYPIRSVYVHVNLSSFSCRFAFTIQSTLFSNDFLVEFFRRRKKNRCIEAAHRMLHHFGSPGRVLSHPV